ncbi:MAG: DUF58 domain-containing protein [Cyclobacteriaceae bacterium]
MQDLLKKLRKYEVRIRKAITSHMQGDFHSVFKGSGLEFDDVRPYQYGDDVRSIDWNVSAKGHGTYVKTFKEEKEQTVFFILDVSASQEIGTDGRKKLDIGKEICALLTISAIKESSQVGLICYSDQDESYVKPRKGIKHSYEVINKLFKLNPKSLKTDIKGAIKYALSIIKRRSVIILVSDFIDEGYEHNLKALAKKHDLVVVHIYDVRETTLPKLGIVPLYDQESKKTVWVNTSSGAFRKKMERLYGDNRAELEKLCRRHQANYLSVRTDEDYVPKLIKLFKVRNRMVKVG